jgi:hypothetical protein
VPSGARSVTTVEDEVARLDQALLDLSHSGGAAVSLVHCPAASRAPGLARELGRAGRARGFVTAQLSLAETPVDAFEQLVAGLLESLVPADGARPVGLLRLLDAFAVRHGKRALDLLDAGVEEHTAEGDLAALCRAYLAAEDQARVERALAIWMSGTRPERRNAVEGVRGCLDAHTAQRVLRDLTRVVRALGYRGTLALLTDAEALAERTERQRERGYTVVRELVDNFDSGRGAVATKFFLLGGDALFFGTHALGTLRPLAMRLELPSGAEPPPPHRTFTSLVREPFEYVHRRVRAPEDARPAALRSLIRVAQGLPPTEAVTSMSVGHERIDRTVDKLLHHAENAGSVFQVLSGEYGSGKTHLLLHLAERALAQGHPVFWLNLERMNLDLGNPARHLARVLDSSVMPRRGRPSALDRAAAWTRSRPRLRALLEALGAIAATEAEEAVAARKALAAAEGAEEPGAALEDFLSARDLVHKPSGPSYRHDAYRRLLLWAELLRRLDECQGPVVLVDEAENLYSSGLSRVARRAALRSLSFYCGGALPNACVIVAMTPEALGELRQESGSLLSEQAELESTLDLEDVEVFRRRLARLVPDEVPEFTRPMRLALAERVRHTHQSVRGATSFEDWESIVRSAVSAGGPPRVLVRHLVDELESAWWAGG